MYIRESVLEKMDWQYATKDDGIKVRFALYGDSLIAQQRITVSETSRRRLLSKALQGEYDLTNMQVKGTGNSYLVLGWENINLFADITIAEASLTSLN